MKEKIIVIIKCLLGFSLTGVGIFCLTYFTYQNNKIKADLQQAMDSATIYAYREEESLLDTETIESLYEDQEVEEVVAYNSVLEIPSVDITVKINDGVDSYSLLTGVGRYVETAQLGAIGTTVIAGHSSDVYDCIFNDLPKVKTYDKFYIYDVNGFKHTYYITQKFTCSPYYTEILTNDTSIGISRVILFCCANGGQDRYMVEGYEFSEDQFKEYIANIGSIRIEYVDSVLNSYVCEPITKELDYLLKKE